jgi:hypothetical protein
MRLRRLLFDRYGEVRFAWALVGMAMLALVALAIDGRL